MALECIVPQAGLHRSGKGIVANASQVRSDLRARLCGKWKSRGRELIPRSQDEEDAQAHGTDHKEVIQSSAFHRRERGVRLKAVDPTMVRPHKQPGLPLFITSFVAATLLHILATNSKRASRFLISASRIATKTCFHTLSKVTAARILTRPIHKRCLAVRLCNTGWTRY